MQNNLPMLDFSEDWAYALDVLENHGGNIALTGFAGTGKSTLIKHFLSKTNRNVLVFGTTGVAALEVGGMTVHKFFGIAPTSFPEPGSMKEDYIKALALTDTIIIDEGMMLRADITDALNATMCSFLNTNAPFGGKRVVFVGDALQIGPVVRYEENKDFNGGRYHSPYFFNSLVFPSARFACVELTTPHRQCDPLLLESLNAFRNGKPEQKHLDLFNSRVTKKEELPEDVLRLYPKNIDADTENMRKLDAIPLEVKDFVAIVEGEIKESEVPVQRLIMLKVGARVMLARNYSQSLVNGMCGTVLGMTGASVTVKFDSGTVSEISPMTWESKKYKTLGEEVLKETTGVFIQLPLKLAWAITINKSQGQTFDRCIISFKGGIFASGQAYVASSRCRTLEGIYLEQPVKASDFRADKHAIKFMEDVRNGKYPMIRGAVQQSMDIDVAKPVFKNMCQFKMRDDSKGKMVDEFATRFYQLENVDDNYDIHIVESLRKFLSTSFGASSEGMGFLVPASENDFELLLGEKRRFPSGSGAFIIGDSVYGVRFSGEKWEPFGKDENRALVRTVAELPIAGVIPFFPELVVEN